MCETLGPASPHRSSVATRKTAKVPRNGWSRKRVTSWHGIAAAAATTKEAVPLGR